MKRILAVIGIYVGIFVIYVGIPLTVWSVAIYVAWHFISKYW